MAESATPPHRHVPPRNPAADDPRVPLAAERTLLAWIRTGLALMGFGFVLARYDLIVHEMSAGRGTPAPSQDHLSHWAGVTLVVLGVVVNVLSTVQHAAYLRHLARGVPPRPRALSLATVLSLILATLGLALAAYLVIQP